ncbi:MAG: hypothetical protein ACRDQB_08820 [Thermocrispum sp.]
MPTLEQLRSARPPEVGNARVLAIVAIVLWLPVAGAFLTPPQAATSSSGLFAVLAFLHVWGAFGVVSGRQAGRIVAAVTTAFLYFMLLPFCWLGFSARLCTGTSPRCSTSRRCWSAGRVSR